MNMFQESWFLGRCLLLLLRIPSAHLKILVFLMGGAYKYSIANQPWTATKNSLREKKYREMYGKFETQQWTLSGTATSLQFFLIKILFLVPKVSNSWIFQKQCFMKIIWHRISIQTLLFQDVFAYLSKWHWKPWWGLLGLKTTVHI